MVGWVVLLTAMPALAAGLPHLARGMPYAQARRVLVRQGYTPFTANPDPARCRTMAGVCEAYPEVVSCRVEGRGGCNLQFRGPAGDLQVTATGRSVGMLRVWETGIPSYPPH